MVCRAGNRDGDAMKRIQAFCAIAAILFAACATVPPQGDAVECDACRTIWIRLFPSSGAAGIYRLNHDEKHRPCRNCERLAARYFESGEIPQRCPRCGGVLALRPVRVTP